MVVVELAVAELRPIAPSQRSSAPSTAQSGSTRREAHGLEFDRAMGCVDQSFRLDHEAT